MKEKDTSYTYVWSIKKKMVVARSIKQAIDIYCVQFDAQETDISSIDRMDSYGDELALIKVEKETVITGEYIRRCINEEQQEEAQP